MNRIIHDSESKYISLEPSEYFRVNRTTRSMIEQAQVNMDLLGQIVFYRTYSRYINGKQERWNDVVLRVIEGIITIRKNWYIERGLPWPEQVYQLKAQMLARSMLDMKWSPPGRGLWSMGTEQMYTRGAACLYNCGAVGTADFKKSICWAMNHLMLGVGVGFKISDFWEDRKISNEKYVDVIPDEKNTVTYIVDDSREGWVDSLRALFDSYQKDTDYSGKNIVFDYSQIRKEGEPLKCFGGVSSGYKPLAKLHEQIRSFLNVYIESVRDEPACTRFTADCINALGACVVSGNIRRTAEILLGDINSDTFLNLKNLDVNPDRSSLCYFSNNSVMIKRPDDIKNVKNIIPSIIHNGEPGIVNMYNAQKYFRMGDIQPTWDEDNGPTNTMCPNPCGEIPLEYYELCNLADVNISKCENKEDFLKACECACFYCSTVNLLKTGCSDTNAVISKNRRIGVSLSGICDFLDNHTMSEFIDWSSAAYTRIREKNKQLAEEAGINPSIAITTIKPSGTVSLLSNVSPGIHPRLFKEYIRRIRVAKQDKICSFLIAAGIPYEDDLYNPDTYVFEIPVKSPATRTQRDYTIWEQMQNVAIAQRYYVDNMISVTVTFSKKEESELQRCIESYISEIKGVSFLPFVDSFYKQMPYEGITHEEFIERSARIRPIDWEKFIGSDGTETIFCDSDKCVMNQ